MKFRFTIRDGLFVIAMIGLSLAWWIDHRRLTAEIAEARSAIGMLGMELTLARMRAFFQEEARIDGIREAAKNSPPSREDVDEIIRAIRQNPDFRIRVRAMAVVPYFREREEGIDVLLEALRERTSERSADGVVPQYAATYLAEMKATRAIDDVKAWLDFLKQESPFSDSIRPMLIKQAERRLAELTAGTESP